MKKISLITLVLLMVLSISATQAAPSLIHHPIREKVTLMTEEQMTARLEEMKKRVADIKAMDKSQLTKEQRRDLRKELRNMNKEAKAIHHSGVYISFAALIIIILLLILLL